MTDAGVAECGCVADGVGDPGRVRQLDAARRNLRKALFTILMPLAPIFLCWEPRSLSRCAQL